MSESLYDIAALRFWTEAEIETRENMIRAISLMVRKALTETNRAWVFERVEGPTLTPQTYVSDAYDDSDIYVTTAKVFGDKAVVMRPETTMSSYLYARWLMNAGKTYKAPLCVWQAGKSYRREQNDGASFSKLRLNEFYQLEFQCIYKSDSLADYRGAILDPLRAMITSLTGGKETRIVPSDRLPAYSKETLDVEILRNGARWTEVCSISQRTDFDEHHLVLEIALGLDRLVAIAGELKD